MPHKSRRVGAVIALAILGTTLAEAQTITIHPQGSTGADASARISGLRVQVQTIFTLPGTASGDLSQQRSVTEAGRRAVYEIAAQECKGLSEVFKADCRITSLNATSSVQNRNSGQEGVQVNGTISYELTSRSN